MKRKDLIRHLLKNGCIFIREGAKHSVFFNPLIKKTSTVPRHKEVDNFLAKKICQDLGIELPKKGRK
ncbi:MAG: type II toxin-antitoxin system HicA family toxin [Candidatus Paceibacterales bacterium]